MEKPLECCVEEHLIVENVTRRAKSSCFEKTSSVIGSSDEVYAKFLKMEAEKLEEKKSEETSSRGEPNCNGDNMV